MKTRLLIRKARLEDLERIVGFNIQMAKETEGKALDREIVREGVQSVLSNKSKGFYLVAENTNGARKIVGQSMVTYEWSDWRNKDLWWIQSVYVNKRYRNKKIFSKLFRAVAKMALSTISVDALRLYVKENNNFAKQVYESLGMKKTFYEVYEKPL
jgi:ribosomal protein S18 acetylase RimI-like enzyme